jgi:lysylphosphatidylglycerol synthetase-like protein (DUF2156 family)
MNNKRADVVSIIILAGFLTILFALVIMALLPKQYSIYRFLAIPLTIFTIVLIAALLFERIDLRTYLNKIGDKEGYPVISVLYGNFISKKYNKISTWLSVIALVLLVILSFVRVFEYDLCVSLLPLFLVLILQFRSKVINSRIKAGVFGTNATEVKELINFMLSNYENIDFTDGSGNIKKSFLPEDLLLDRCSTVEIAGVIIR